MDIIEKIENINNCLLDEDSSKFMQEHINKAIEEILLCNPIKDDNSLTNKIKKLIIISKLEYCDEEIRSLLKKYIELLELSIGFFTTNNPNIIYTAEIRSNDYFIGVYRTFQEAIDSVDGYYGKLSPLDKPERKSFNIYKSNLDDPDQVTNKSYIILRYNSENELKVRDIIYTDSDNELNKACKDLLRAVL